MKKVCNFCGNKNFKKSTVKYVYRREERLLVVNGVPCEECEYCGEQYFEAADLKKIEQDFFAVYEDGKKAKAQTTVPVEEFTEIAG